MWQPSKYLKGQRGRVLVAVTPQSIFIHWNLGKWMLCSESCLDPHIPVVMAHKLPQKLISSKSEEEGISSSIEQAERKRWDFMNTFPELYDGW